MSWRWALCGALCGLVGGAQAVDLDALARRAVRALAPPGAEVVFVGDRGQGTGAPAACPGGLDQQVVTTRLAPRMEVRFQCVGASGWITHRALLWHVYQPVLVTTRPLARLDAINADTAHFERRDLTQLGYGYIAESSVLGQRFVARPLAAGTVLTPAMLMHHEWVKTGDQVALQSHFAGLVVQAAGIALSGGDQGERVRVRNASSGKVLEAVVVAQGVVEVMP